MNFNSILVRFLVLFLLQNNKKIKITFNLAKKLVFPVRLFATNSLFRADNYVLNIKLCTKYKYEINLIRNT